LHLINGLYDAHRSRERDFHSANFGHYGKPWH
jgi:hypothetical protein